MDNCSKRRVRKVSGSSLVWMLRLRVLGMPVPSVGSSLEAMTEMGGDGRDRGRGTGKGTGKGEF